MTQTTCPFGKGYDFTDPDVLLKGIPVTEFAELRRTAPVWWNEQGESIFDDGGYWVISRHEDIKSISRNGELWSTNRKGAVMRMPDGTTAEPTSRGHRSASPTPSSTNSPNTCCGSSSRSSSTPAVLPAEQRRCGHTCAGGWRRRWTRRGSAARHSRRYWSFEASPSGAESMAR